jgi:hypothetical protein
VAATVVAFVLAGLVLWAGLGIWLGRLRLEVLAWAGVVAVPAFAIYVAVRNTVTVLGLVAAAASWLAFVALLLRVTRRRARRAGEDVGTRTPS